ncbi:MAG: LLM class flavin-dependent oxidoreductase, partial [Anaerolineales bacterium]|nr:LLM class flavin-dependent oxidoreductase [Anaerolineales bacterium]
MKFDAVLPPMHLKDVPTVAHDAEETGFDALWTTETQHDGFLPHPLIAEHTQKIKMGTAVAIAFARSPGDIAYTAWDLAAQSQGRFILGLGTQVKGHITKRFGMPWPDSVVGKLREQIGAIRALWQTWQTGEKLRFKGEYYNLRLMSPFFNPGKIAYPDIPIYIAGVNTGLARLAGEVCDGFHAHPFNSPRYLREVLVSNPKVDLLSFFILRTLGDDVGAPTSELSLIPFPSNLLFSDYLNSFDLIIFQNFRFEAFIDKSLLGNLKNYVMNGGAFLMIGGELSFQAGGYERTPIEDILPVIMQR